MILRLEEIPSEGLDVTVPLKAEALASEGARPVGPVFGEFRLTRQGFRVQVKGRVSGRFTVPCSRCLVDAESPVEEELFVELLPEDAAGDGGGELELSGGDLDVGFYRGGEIDMGEFVAEQVRLALPMKPLCSEGCRGLCPACGHPRQEGCSCEGEPADDRWEALRGLLKK